MSRLDDYLRDARMNRARPYVSAGDVVVDVGCAEGTLFRRWHDLIGHGIGVDPLLEGRVEADRYVLYPGRFPDALSANLRCDVVTMLAVLEHVPRDEQERWADACVELLKPGGRMVITVPSPWVDDILRILLRLRLIDGMSVHEHYGFRPELTPTIFAPPRFRLLVHRRFQLGLNNLFVFERS